MLYQGSGNIMIELTEIQAQIIEKLIENKENVPHQNFLGLSSRGLEKLGVNRRTFEINREFMLHYQLIKKVHEEEHNFEVWRYYNVTQLGFLALLKWLSPKEIQKINVKKFDRFIPFIAIHWDKLLSWYGEKIFSILKQSIEQVEVKPFLADLNLKEKQPSWNKIFVEKTRLDFVDPGVEMILTRVFGIYSDKEKYESEKNGIKLYFPNFEDMRNNVIRRLTFVFYFNLIRARYEISLHKDLWKVKPKGNISSSPDEIDKDVRKIGLQYKKTLKRMNEASSEVISIITRDPELRSIINDNLNEIAPKFNQPKIITILREKLK